MLSEESIINSVLCKESNKPDLFIDDIGEPCRFEGL